MPPSPVPREADRQNRFLQQTYNESGTSRILFVQPTAGVSTFVESTTIHVRVSSESLRDRWPPRKCPLGRF